MELTNVQKKALHDNGYIQISGAIPSMMVDEALRVINHSIGEGMNKDEMSKFRTASFAPEVRDTAPITDLFNKTPVKSLVASVVDLEQVEPITHAQIALRFPVASREPRKPHPHIDGMYYPNNGVPEGTIQNFTALVGVFLSDLPNKSAGNFAVWPESHHKFEKHFQEFGAEALLEGMPKIDIGEPVEITGKAGDVVIAHYMLGHGITVNVSPHVRYALFFRVKHKDTRTNWQESMENIWLHWPGMKEIVNR